MPLVTWVAGELQEVEVLYARKKPLELEWLYRLSPYTAGNPAVLLTEIN